MKTEPNNMYPEDIDKGLLVRSRNRLPSIPFRQAVDAIDSALISAWVDIFEPLVCASGEIKNVPFTYRSGIPSSYAFGIDWFLTESDQIAGENKLTTGVPLTTIFPHQPLGEGARILAGFVNLTAPVVMMSTLLYGKMTIFQV